MSLFQLWKHRALIGAIFTMVRRALQGVHSLADARNKVAARLAIGARAGDLDPMIRILCDSDTLIADFKKNG